MRTLFQPVYGNGLARDPLQRSADGSTAARHRRGPTDRPTAPGDGRGERDRPPVFGIVGRQTKRVRLAVVHHRTRQELEPRVLEGTVPGACVNRDEGEAYHHLPEADR